jgi:hypothetical protein
MNVADMLSGPAGLLVFLVLWLVLQTIVLPRLGVGT